MSILRNGLRGIAIAAAVMISASARAETPIALLAFGDSLTAGYGLPQEQAFPQVLERRLADMGWNVKVRNGGVSGDTSAGGRARLDWMLEPKPDAVILELGANDALRGLPPEQLHDNLAAILKTLQDRQIPVLLAGMMAPRNLGPDYVKTFDQIYPSLSRAFDVPLYPFFLGPALSRKGLTLADGLHPNAEGVRMVVEGILPDVLKLLETVKAAKGPGPERVVR
jgi:acyl-CoA thioesterase-1